MPLDVVRIGPSTCGRMPSAAPIVRRKSSSLSTRETASALTPSAPGIPGSAAGVRIGLNCAKRKSRCRASRKHDPAGRSIRPPWSSRPYGSGTSSRTSAGESLSLRASSSPLPFGSTSLRSATDLSLPRSGASMLRCFDALRMPASRTSGTPRRIPVVGVTPAARRAADAHQPMRALCSVRYLMRPSMPLLASVAENCCRYTTIAHEPIMSMS